jgi:hypothetical protein
MEFCMINFGVVEEELGELLMGAGNGVFHRDFRRKWLSIRGNQESTLMDNEAGKAESKGERAGLVSAFFPGAPLKLTGPEQFPAKLAQAFITRCYCRDFRNAGGRSRI